MNHILKKLQDLEGNDQAMSEYIADLLITKRPDREGLPPKLTSFLVRLQKSLKTKSKIPWTY